MADRKIDYDRGVIINVHPGTGMDVFMYVDSPGKFMTAHGTVVPDAIAKESGYDTDRLTKERIRLERKAKASELIDQELSDDAQTAEQCVKVVNGFRLVTIGLDRYNVKDPDDNLLNVHPMALVSAEKLLSAMAGEEVVADDKSAGSKKAK